jgi:hypothetical protein
MKGNKVQFLVEAKKEGLGFENPPNFKSRHYVINGTLAKCAELKKTI